MVSGKLFDNNSLAEMSSLTKGIPMFGVVYICYVGIVIVVYVYKSQSSRRIDPNSPSVNIGSIDAANVNIIEIEHHFQSLNISVVNDNLVDAEEDKKYTEENEHLRSLLGGSDDIELDIEEAVTTNDAPSQCKRTIGLIRRLISAPIKQIFRSVIPSLQGALANVNHMGNSLPPSRNAQPVSLRRAIFSLIMSIIFISISATAIITICESLISNLGLETATIGATLVAFGTEVNNKYRLVPLNYRLTNFTYTF